MLLAELHAPVSAAVFYDVDRSFVASHDNDRLLADESAFEIAGARQLRFERDVVPARTAEDAVLLPSIDLPVGVDPVGDAGNAFCRPHVARAHGFVSCCRRLSSAARPLAAELGQEVVQAIVIRITDDQFPRT